jgi:predicted pyridoxine 5'-phosphate oxidase superfamily flavin-nucleotide-binding protein
MSMQYGGEARRLQDQFDSRRLADRLAETIVRGEASEEDRAFIASRDFFFLSTLDAEGWPTVSYKGGPSGFVQPLDARTLLFPCYDGNGMFLSMGNLAGHPQIGMLFIDFESPKRLRLAGRAEIVDDPVLVGRFHEAQFAVVVTIARLWPNCPRYIHRHQRVESSPYVPRPGVTTPDPEWKRFPAFIDSLPQRDKARLAGDEDTATSP